MHLTFYHKFRYATVLKKTKPFAPSGLSGRWGFPVLIKNVPHNKNCGIILLILMEYQWNIHGMLVEF